MAATTHDISWIAHLLALIKKGEPCPKGRYICKLNASMPGATASPEHGRTGVE